MELYLISGVFAQLLGKDNSKGLENYMFSD